MTARRGEERPRDTRSASTTTCRRYRYTIPGRRLFQQPRAGSRHHDTLTPGIDGDEASTAS